MTVVRLGQKNDPSKEEVIAMLHEAIDRLESGELEFDRALLLFLEPDPDSFIVRFMNAGMRMSECISLCEIAKVIFLRQMNYIPDGE